MRDIKIRAWNKNQNEMIFDGIDYEIKMLSLPPLDEPRDSQIGFLKDDVSRIFELMQSTGLKDQNDNEIYEGDILKFDADEEYKCEAHDIPYIIKWCDEDACFECENSMNFMSAKLWAHMEVIGNIYETPELIEVIHQR